MKEKGAKGNWQLDRVASQPNWINFTKYLYGYFVIFFEENMGILLEYEQMKKSTILISYIWPQIPSKYLYDTI